MSFLRRLITTHPRQHTHTAAHRHQRGHLRLFITVWPGLATLQPHPLPPHSPPLHLPPLHPLPPPQQGRRKAVKGVVFSSRIVSVSAPSLILKGRAPPGMPDTRSSHSGNRTVRDGGRPSVGAPLQLMPLMTLGMSIDAHGMNGDKGTRAGTYGVEPEGESDG